MEFFVESILVVILFQVELKSIHRRGKTQKTWTSRLRAGPFTAKCTRGNRSTVDAQRNTLRAACSVELLESGDVFRSENE